MRRRRLRRIGAILVTLASLTVIVALATGEVALVTTHGISMEPRFHSGDLAVIIPGSPYHVGEIVAYHSPLLNTTVLHRIVAEHDGLFTFKGDNNSFLDPQKLPASDIKGRLWLHIPRGGIVLGWVRSPIILGLLAFFLVALVVGGATRRSRARGPRTGPAAGRPGPKHAAPRTEEPWWPVVLAAATAMLFIAPVVASWSRPATRPSVRHAAYEQTVAFSYSASAPAGPAYPTGTVSTGDAVFLKLVQTLEVTARYRFGASTARSSASRPDMSGTIAAEAVLEGPNGWSSPLGSVAPVAFSGPSASVAIPVPLGQIDALEQEFYTETGVPLDLPQIVITPTVHVHGRFEGASVDDTYSPSLTFPDDGQELELDSTVASPTSAQSKQLNPESPGSVDLPTRVAAKVTVLGRSVAVSELRHLALGGLFVSLLATLWAWLWIARHRRMDETARIRTTYHHDLIPVTSSPAAQARLVVDVQTFGALARLARRYDCMILELQHTNGHVYYVECGATVYRHGVEPGYSVLRLVEDPQRPTDLTYFVGSSPSVSTTAVSMAVSEDAS